MFLSACYGIYESVITTEAGLLRCDDLLTGGIDYKPTGYAWLSIIVYWSFFNKLTCHKLHLLFYSLPSKAIYILMFPLICELTRIKPEPGIPLSTLFCFWLGMKLLFNQSFTRKRKMISEECDLR